MVHAGTILEDTKGVFSQRAAFFHDARFLFHPLFVAVNNRFMFPAMDLFNSRFFA